MVFCWVKQNNDTHFSYKHYVAADDANKLAQGYMVTDTVVVQLGIRSIPRSDGK